MCIRDSSKKLEQKGIRVIRCDATKLSEHLNEKVDFIFMSNFLEHMKSKEIVLQVLEECRKVLSRKGKLVILQPNIRYAGSAYWDYIDHHIAITDKSLVEALTISGYSVPKCIPRFLPYSVKSKTGDAFSGKYLKLAVKLYLKMPFLWKIFGAQTLVIAKINHQASNKKAL